MFFVQLLDLQYFQLKHEGFMYHNLLVLRVSLPISFQWSFLNILKHADTKIDVLFGSIEIFAIDHCWYKNLTLRVSSCSIMSVRSSMFAQNSKI